MECRAFPCRCDHRDDWLGSAWAVLIVVTVIRLSGCLGCPLRSHKHSWCLRVVGLGVDRIVDALRLLLECTPSLTPRTVLRRLVACVVGVLLFVLAY